jgi:hypothetical protein
MTTEFAKAFESDNDEVEQSSGQRFEEAEVIQQEEPKQTGNEPQKVQL